MELQEYISAERLQAVIDCGNLPKKESDDEEWSSKALPSILKDIQDNMEGDSLTVNYSQKFGTYGRFYCDRGLQRINSEIKKYLVNGRYRDLDIQNAHPIFLDHIFKKYGVYDEFLTDYCTDRTKAMKKYKLRFKKTIISQINSRRFKLSSLDPRILEFHTKLYDIFEKEIKTDKPFYKSLEKFITERKKKEGKPLDNVQGSMMSYFLQNIENEIVQSATEFLNESGIPVDVLMFDGVMIDSKYNIPEELLKEMEEHVLKHTKYSVKFVEKDMDITWEPELKIVEPIAPLYNLSANFNISKLREMCKRAWSYDENGKLLGIDWNNAPDLIEYMSLYFCQFQSPVAFGFRNNTRDRYTFMDSQAMCHITKSTSPTSGTYPAWHIYKTHIDSVLYDKTDFVIDFPNNDVINEVYEDTQKSKGLNVYNLYKRPESIPLENPESIQEILDFILEIISDNDLPTNKLLLDWIAFIIKFGKTGIALVLLGGYGEGKGTFVMILKAIIGLVYCYTDNCGSRIGTRFNGHEEAKLLGIFEEVTNNNGEQHLRNEIMKNMITDKDNMIEKKGIEIYPSTNNCNYIFVTNGQNPVKIDKDQRRYVAIRVSSKRKQDRVFFGRILQLIKQEKFHLRDYFQNREVTMDDMKVINTKANEQLMFLNQAGVVAFCEEWLPLITKDVHKIRPKDLYQLYIDYRVENMVSGKGENYKYFTDFIITNTPLKYITDSHRRTWFINNECKDVDKEYHGGFDYDWTIQEQNN